MYMGQENSWASDLITMGRTTADILISEQAQPIIQNVIKPILLGPMWNEESILTPNVLPALLQHLHSHALKIEMKSQRIRIEEIPDFDSVSSVIPQLPSSGSLWQLQKGNSKVSSSSSDPKASRRGRGRPKTGTLTTGQQMSQFISLHKHEREVESPTVVKADESNLAIKKSKVPLKFIFLFSLILAAEVTVGQPRRRQWSF